MKNKTLHLYSEQWLILFIVLLGLGINSHAGIWTSAQELSNIPMSGAAWAAVKEGADEDTSNPDVANQDDPTNVRVLAAAIVYARTGNEAYKEKVVAAIEKLVEKGHPGGRTLAWAREGGAYALAADLVGYRTESFESWLNNMAEVWQCSQLGISLLEMYKRRPNNWGIHAFGTLTSIYRYLDRMDRLQEIRNYFALSVNGFNPGYDFGSDLSWHLDESKPMLINPEGAVKNGFKIDGIQPDDMRRGGSFQDPPIFTGYVWEGMQGYIQAGRVLERAGMPIWDLGNKAIYRSMMAYQIRLAAIDSAWEAGGDDMWMFGFLNKAYGTQINIDKDQIWGAGKNVGWAYVTIGDSGNPPPPANQAPNVNAGTDQSITLSEFAVMEGAVSDDGLPNPPGQVTITWSKVSGPGTVSFGESAAGDTTATFSATGTYVLRLQAYDGELYRFDTVSITVNQAQTYTLTLTANNGVITANPSKAAYSYGDTVQLTATPAAGYQFSNWMGNLSGSVNPATIVTNANLSIGAVFTRIVYNITASPDPGGTIAPSGQVSVNHGANKTFTIIPNSGYRIEDVLVDAISQGARAVYEFVNVTADHVIKAVFALNPSGSSGSGEHKSQNVIRKGQEVRLWFEVKKAGHMRVSVCGRGGEVIKKLAEGTYEAGWQEFIWDGRNEEKEAVGSGVYLVIPKGEAEINPESVKVVVIK